MSSAARSHVLAVALTASAVAACFPGVARSQEVEEAPPHVLRLSGDGAVVARAEEEIPLETGDPALFGDQVHTGDAYLQLLWSDGSRVALDRATRAEAVSPVLLALTAGRAIVVRPAASEAESLRVDTPAAAVTLEPDGEYHLEVADDQGVVVGVARGRATMQAAGKEHPVDAGRQMRLRGDGRPEGVARAWSAPTTGSFDAWAADTSNEAAAGRANTRRPLEAFADPRIEAYSDVFNRNGSWQDDPRVGMVWYPSVGADWRPYSRGFWQPYGGDSASWLWVGRDAWSWPTHHFGRWGLDASNRWYWTPGRQWGPGWVQWSVGQGYVGWSPLDPTDRPAAPWNEFASQGARGSRGWVVVPSDRLGARQPLTSFAVDPREVPGLSTFVTQRTAPRMGPGGVVIVPGGRRQMIGPTPRQMGPAPAPEDPYQRAAPQMPVPGRSTTRPATPPEKDIP